VLPETYDSGFRLALMLKDMRIAVDLARQIGSPATLGESAVDLWARAAEALPEGADHTEIARWAEGNEAT
jgi:3-hydroxyisobutyrate dehydrogenase